MTPSRTFQAGDIHAMRAALQEVRLEQIAGVDRGVVGGPASGEDDDVGPRFADRRRHPLRLIGTAGQEPPD